MRDEVTALLKLMAKSLCTIPTLLALAACGIKSRVVDEAVMSATYECASYAKQQTALHSLRRFGDQEPLELRCDSPDCSSAFAQAPAFGGEMTLQASPGYLVAGWFNAPRLPNETQKGKFRAAAEGVTDCKLSHRDGW